MNIWNTFNMPSEDDWSNKPIYMPFGEWPWSKTIKQRFTKENAKEIAAQVKDMIFKGELGIPVYQGHPDCPEVAAKYPDKAAIGWVKKIDVGEDGVFLFVEWERFPGKGFGWMSPYWTGDWDRETKTLTVRRIISIGLVNDPNIRTFRLPNEEQAGLQTKNKGENSMDIETLKTELGLPAEAGEAEVMAALKKLKTDAEANAAAKAKAETAQKEAENACGDAKKKLENAEKDLDDTKRKLANAEKDLDDTKKALENEKAEVEKMKGVKTKSVTEGLANTKTAGESEILALVNEVQAKENCDFDEAWGRVKKDHPELFA